MHAQVTLNENRWMISTFFILQLTPQVCSNERYLCLSNSKLAFYEPNCICVKLNLRIIEINCTSHVHISTRD